MEKLNILPQYFYKFALPDTVLDSSLNYATELEYDLQSGQVIFDKRDTPQLTSFIEDSLDEVRIAEQINFEYIKPHLMWSNKRVNGEWHSRHTHPNSFLSGIIYLNTCDARTWFSIPNLWRPQNEREYVIGAYPNNKDDNEIIHKHDSEAGVMLIFPSHLTHSVDNNNSDMDRYTISFNAFPCGKCIAPEDRLYGINIQII